MGAVYPPTTHELYYGGGVGGISGCDGAGLSRWRGGDAHESGELSRIECLGLRVLLAAAIYTTTASVGLGVAATGADVYGND